MDENGTPKIDTFYTKIYILFIVFYRSGRQKYKPIYLNQIKRRRQNTHKVQNRFSDFVQIYVAPLMPSNYSMSIKSKPYANTHCRYVH